jgi:hypothetical protein
LSFKRSGVGAAAAGEGASAKSLLARHSIASTTIIKSSIIFMIYSASINMAELQEEEDYELPSSDRDDEMVEEDGDQDLIEEEHEYGTDEEVDKRQYGIYQALPVDDAEPDWESGEPATVEEYLRRVR